jgi:hypothetical protein
VKADGLPDLSGWNKRALTVRSKFGTRAVLIWRLTGVLGILPGHAFSAESAQSVLCERHDCRNEKVVWCAEQLESDRVMGKAARTRRSQDLMARFQKGWILINCI